MYSDFPNLVRFWDFTEVIDDAVNKTDVTDSIVGAILPDIAITNTQPCTIGTHAYVRCLPTDAGAFLNNGLWVRNNNKNNCLQPDYQGGGGVDFTQTTEHPNLGSDDFLFLVSGHSLVTNATGTKVGLGQPSADHLGGVSYIIAAANNSGSGTPIPGAVSCVKDTLGNTADFSALDQPWGFTQGDPDGSLLPYLWAIYRKDGNITRRIVQLHTGDESKESVSAAGLTGDVHPNFGWFWYDQITYGAALFHFPLGTPDDVDEACDWMAREWDTNFDDKTNSIWPSWAEDTSMKFSDAPVKSGEIDGSESLGAGFGGSDIQLTPERLRNFSNRTDIRIKHWWKCDESSGTTLVDAIAGANVTLATGISGNASGYCQFTAPDLTALPVGGSGLWQPGASDFLFLAQIKQSRPQFSTASISYGDSGLSSNEQVTFGANLVNTLIRGGTSVASLTNLNNSSDGNSFPIAISKEANLVRQWGQKYANDSVPAEFLVGNGEIEGSTTTVAVGSFSAVSDVMTLATAECAGIMMIEFPYGVPLDVDTAIRWMGRAWSLANKSLYPNWNVIT